MAAGLLGCNPATTRPDFLPLPAAPIVYLEAAPDRVTREIAAWLETAGLRIANAEPRDGYVASDWYDPVTRRAFATERDLPFGEAERAFRIRCWAGADVRGASRVAVEATYRPRYDPSLPPRDLERLAPEGHAGHALARRLIEDLERRLEVPPERR